MRILVVDDSNSKMTHIVSSIKEIDHEFVFYSEVDIIGAKKQLAEIKFDILIVDLMLPVRKDASLNKDGGLQLVKEIKRDNNLKTPNYIIGITQYEEYTFYFPKIWKVLLYSPSSNAWSIDLKEIVQHVIRAAKSQSDILKPISPTIYLEGKTDELIVRESINLFFPEFADRVDLKYEGGVNLVIKKLIVWAFNLQKDSKGAYVKAIGILDGDAAAAEGKKEFLRYVTDSNVGQKFCKILQLSQNRATNTIPLFVKGISFGICLEDMFPPNILIKAQDMNWLEKRNINDPKGWDRANKSMNQHLSELGLSAEEEIYLYKVKTNNKEDFCRLVLDLKDDDKKLALKNFEKPLSEAIQYLFEVAVD